MTIIVFLVDTSASMNQRTYMGTTLLDVAKGAVETFMKIRSRDQNCRWDRYMLLTFEEPPGNVKAGWKENHATFMKELKNLKAVGLTILSSALKQTFDLLNVNRMQSGIDTYGQGRCPFYLEPAIIVCLTDGRKMTTTSGATNDLLMTNTIPGSELTKEPFRWDQRLFSIVLRMPATVPNELSYIPSAEETSIDAMCEATGGRSYCISSQRMLVHCLESLVQKCQSGVVVGFERIPSDIAGTGNDSDGNGQPPAWQSCRKQIYVPRSAQKGYTVGHWPIPESFWPDLNSPTLPPRSAHPVLRFSCQPLEPITLDNMPFDKYELEPSPLTQYILERRQPNVAWQVFVANSARYNDIGHPFGYLKSSSTQTSVNLFVMPYNYPQLIDLLEELFKVHKLKPTLKWRQQFDCYLKSMPLYYTMPLKRALVRMGAPNIISDQIENCLSYTVVAYLKKLKNQAKIEYDRLVGSVGQSVPLCQGIKVVPRTRMSIFQRPDFHQMLAHHNSDMSALKFEVNDYETFALHVPDRATSKPCNYLNPFDIPRSKLLSRISRMRTSFLKFSSSATQIENEELIHSAAVQDMGNYQEFLKKQPAALRVIETLPIRQHTFGNPFKVNKNIMIDEADEAMPGQSVGRKRSASESSIIVRSNKKKRGPFPRDISARQLISSTCESVGSASPVSTSDCSSPSVYSNSSKDGSEGDEEQYDKPETDSPVHGASTNNSITTNHLPTEHFYHDSSADNKPTVDSSLHGMTNGNREMLLIQSEYVNNELAVEDLDHNAVITRLAVKEVRRPGKNYSKLFELLQDLHGNASLKASYMHKVIIEALRFKKLTLINLLESYMNSQKFTKSTAMIISEINIDAVSDE